MSFYFFLLFPLLPFFCLQCDPGYIAANDSNQCVPCADRGCSYCHSQNFFSCLKCFPEYTLTNRQCGFKCNSIDKCQLCSYDATECVKCIKSCSLEGGKCSCVARNVIIVLLTILSVLIVGIVAYCLMNSKFAKKFNVIEGALGIPIGNGQKVFERRANEIVSIAEKPTIEEKPTMQPERVKKEVNDSKQMINNTNVTDSKEKEISDVVRQKNQLAMFDDK